MLLVSGTPVGAVSAEGDAGRRLSIWCVARKGALGGFGSSSLICWVVMGGRKSACRRLQEKGRRGPAGHAVEQQGDSDSSRGMASCV